MSVGAAIGDITRCICDTIGKGNRRGPFAGSAFDGIAKKPQLYFTYCRGARFLRTLDPYGEAIVLD